MQITLIKLPVASFKRISTPYEEDSVRNYIAVVSVKDIAREFIEWRNLITRDSLNNNSVAEQISETLRDNPRSFFLKNRGLVIAVNKVVFDNKFNELKMEMINRGYEGLIDGKQTLRAIMNFASSASPQELNNLEAYIKLEIIEGVHSGSINDIALARNTSSQPERFNFSELGVDAEKISNIARDYQEGKDTFLFENLSLSESTPKEYTRKRSLSSRTDAEKILPYLMCFDAEYFNSNNHPVKAHKSKAAVIDHFRLNNKNGRMDKYNTLLPQILELHDEIYLTLPSIFNKEIGDFEGLAGVTSNSPYSRTSSKLFRKKETTRYHIPNGYIFPILAAFRCLVEIQDNYCYFKTDPVKLFHELKSDLVQRISDPAMQYRNVSKLGDDTMVWGRCYDLVELTTLKRKA